MTPKTTAATTTMTARAIVSWFSALRLFGDVPSVLTTTPVIQLRLIVATSTRSEVSLSRSVERGHFVTHHFRADGRDDDVD